METRTLKRGKETLCREIEKIVGEGDLNRERLEILHKLTDTLKNFYKIEMAEEYSDNESHRRGRSHDSASHDGHSFDDEYNRAHSERRRHHVDAHYSYNDGRKDMMNKLDELMDDAPTEKDREAIRRCMNLMQNM